MAFSWSLFNWIADMACLAFAAYAAGGKPSLAGLTVAYAAARAVGSIPLMPGGLLVVEAVLVPGLVSSGMTLAAAISAMLIYRLVSWIFISAIGWVVFFFMFRTETDVDPDAGLDEVDQSEAVRDAEPKHDSQRANTADTVPADGNSIGSCRHAIPPPAMYRMASTITRRQCFSGRPPRPAVLPGAANSGSRIAHCASVTDDEYTAQPCPPAAWVGTTGMARSAMIALWAPGLGGDLVITDPTRSRLLRFSARHTPTHREFSNTPSVNLARTPEVSPPMHLTRTTRTDSGRSRTS